MQRSLRFILSLVMIITLLVPMTTFADAQQDSLNDRANALNKINILYGDSKGEYNFPDNLKRSEGAAFIVRLLGKEQLVLNKNGQYDYAKTGFKDVNQDAWYAPYIGYSKQMNIISGYPDGTFKPDDILSEKAFLTLILGALGYQPNIDFTWNNVYQKSFDTGLVTDVTYQNKTADNTNYTRGNVVELIYQSLTMKKNNSEVSMLQWLIDTNIISLEKAKDAGFNFDTTVTKINEILVSDGQIKVTLNENIKQIDETDIKIIAANDATKMLKASIVSQSNNQLIVNTGTQEHLVPYILELKNISDEEGNSVALLSQGFTGYKNTEVVSDYFKIMKVESISKNIIHVYYTQPINLNSEFSLYYEIQQDGKTIVSGGQQSISASLLPGTDNAVAVFVNSITFSPGQLYTLKVSGQLSSIYGLGLNGGTGDQSAFVANGAENEEFRIVSVYPLDNKTIEVEFNTSVDRNSTQLVSNYSLKDDNGSPRGIIGAVVSTDPDKRSKYVRLQIAGTLDSARTYELTVKGISNGFKTTTLPEEKYPFSGVSSNRGDLAIVNISPEDRGTLVVYLDRPLNVNSALNIGYYTITGDMNTIPTKVYYDPTINPYMVKLFLPNGQQLNPTGSYKLVISKLMVDDLNNQSNANSELSFSGTGNENIKPLMYEARVIGNNVMKVQLNKELSTSGTNLVASNYVLEYKDGNNNTVTKFASGVSLVNPTTMLLTFNELSTSYNYTLKAASLQDYSMQYTRTTADGLNTVGVSFGVN